MQASGATGEFGSEISAGITAEMEQERGMLRQELQQAGSSIESLRMEVQVSSDTVCILRCLGRWLLLSLPLYFCLKKITLFL